MKDGYYFYRIKDSTDGWQVCRVREKYVDFFDGISQELKSEYVRKYIEFGGFIQSPEPRKDSIQIKFDNGIKLHVFEKGGVINVYNIADGLKKLVAYPSTVNSIILKGE